MKNAIRVNVRTNSKFNLLEFWEHIFVIHSKAIALDIDMEFMDIFCNIQ